MHLCKQETDFDVVNFHRLLWVGSRGCSFGVFRRCSASALPLNDLQVFYNWVTLQRGDGCLVSHHSRSLAGGGLWKGFYQAQWLQYERHSLMRGDSFRAEYVCTEHSSSICAESRQTVLLSGTSKYKEVSIFANSTSMYFWANHPSLICMWLIMHLISVQFLSPFMWGIDHIECTRTHSTKGINGRGPCEVCRSKHWADWVTQL